MEDISLEELCRGMLAIRANASELLEDAKLLRRNGRISRAYALAYMACEEAGKLPILWGVATEMVLGVPIDWRQTKKRFHSHSSKASQFFALARAMPILLEALSSGRKTIDRDKVMRTAAVGAILGPGLFESRNAAIYCDFTKDRFVAPSNQVDREMSDAMLRFAEINLATADGILNKSAEEIAVTIRANASHDRYEQQQTYAAGVIDKILASRTGD